MFQAFFFDMDGVLFDSMPNHVLAWSETLARYGIPFTARDCYLNEGRTSRDVIMLLANRHHVPVSEEQLEGFFPGIFHPEKMITAFDVKHGKPAPEPYLKAWERSRLDKSQCCVVENAPLGIKAGKAAGLFTIGVNTGALTREDLEQAGADIVFDNMAQLHQSLLAQP